MTILSRTSFLGVKTMSNLPYSPSRSGAIQTVSLSFFRFSRGIDRLWALTMMGAARFMLPGVPGIGFWKLLGSGTGEGFTPIPNTGVYAILAVWPDAATARAQTKGAGVFRRYLARASESWTLFLSPTSVRGQWAGDTPFEITTPVEKGPLAALTRASVRPRKALKFWRRVPDISAVIGADPNVAFKIGVGEVPLLHQVTFSIWPDSQSMADFARRDGPHARAIAAVRDGDWFREELYARFRVIGERGTWGGTSPLEHIKEEQ
ncbi:Spheroidene monooxygenase [Roseovarius sp. EC-HK134]|uniref:Spheroidene monooxygenase n=2 Tax=Roseobacteraceae TaxID=2854170 RepID=A0A1V0RUB6_9RHOB|nr:spheroidene monooxygenase [Roseovarius mucosus]AWZ21433.1 Spheroidene monooxygenase [Roseovarius sp. AK1035]VVT27737.1 Spheroidene monooxygenase [Roseovarius sp. EC-SD190]VVT28237.1 Spheroidene monooxygenase [Roseovarius sp. EC-HK134]